MELCFATNNKHKLDEVRRILPEPFKILSLGEIGCQEELPEYENSLEGNSRLKAKHIYKNYGINCFADDTGLEVDALNGAPGVYSARYAGPENNSKKNIQLLLLNLNHAEERGAQFRTVITLMWNGKEYQFEGVVKGHIINNPRGREGFGYDPVFIPNGYNLTFAEMSLNKKNQISHRARAVRKLSEFLATL